VPRARAALAVLAVALGAAARPHGAAAMQFTPVPGNDAPAVISGRGEIIKGDLARLRTALAAVPAGHKVALLLDSPGGSVAEAEQMGHVIRDGDIAVAIPDNSLCASACFLLLAAAPRRFAAADALVGVHSASESGEETVESMAVTTAMARIAADFDVPAAILGKMVRTVPGRVEWLTHADLVSMDVKILGEPDAAPQHEAAAQPPPAPAHVQPPPPAAVQPAPAAPAPKPVAAPAPAPVPANPAVVSLPPLRPAAASAAVAEFQGAYFCGGPTTLSLKVMDAAGDGRRRAVLAVGPTATNPQVVRGAFMLEGRLDLGGGVLDMHPVAGSSQPTGTAMVGLVGRSDDGGKTFAGRVTSDITCTLFTLRRVR
jgi:hypothetical protein